MRGAKSGAIRNLQGDKKQNASLITFGLYTMEMFIEQFL